MSPDAPESVVPAPKAFHAPAGAPARTLADVKDEYGLDYPQVKAETLIDETFTLLSAKPFDSRFPGQEKAYWCVCRDEDTGELFATVLGGSAVVEVIEQLIAAGLEQPVAMTLRQQSGGKYGRYYTVE